MECKICFDQIKKNKITTVCNHTFHNACLREWLKRNPTCPYCREEYPIYLEPAPSLTLQDILKLNFN